MIYCMPVHGSCDSVTSVVDRVYVNVIYPMSALVVYIEFKAGHLTTSTVG